MVTVGQAGLVLGGLGSLGYQEWKGQDIAGDIALYTITPFIYLNYYLDLSGQELYQQ